MKPKALFIGGTGTISTAITAALAAEGKWDLTLLNRGSRPEAVPEGVHVIKADVEDETAVARLLQDRSWDCVCDFIGFVPAQVERDWRLFRGKTRQYMYISSASAYQKPAASPFITEGTPLANPYWEYSRKKIACEDFLMEKYRQEGFPVTIIRPSHTYGDRSVPLGVHGEKGSWQVLRRMLDGKRVIIHGDGTSQWTLTHNSDFAKGFIGLMGNPHALGNAFQITSDETLSWNQIYQVIADKLGVELKAVHVSSEFLADVGPYDFRGGLLGDKAVTVLFDNSKLKRAVPGFEATVRFEEGVADTIDNILSNPRLQVPDPAFDAWCDRVLEALDRAKASLCDVGGNS
ncbi:MAG: SDR family oxidoreductase [Bacteroidales bacterium]|nr:SDR family oxidoreductase [Bacteroidales bacterium]